MLQSRSVVSNSLISRKYALSTKQSSYETRQVVTYRVTILILEKKRKKEKKKKRKKEKEKNINKKKVKTEKKK